MNVHRKIVCLSASVFVALAVLLDVSWNPRFLALQMNADMLAPLEVIWDLRHDANFLNNFQFARVPSIFPDLTWYWFLSTFIHSRAWEQFAYAVSQFAFLVVVGAWIVCFLSGVEFHVAALSVALIGSFLMWIAGSALIAIPVDAQFDFLLACIHTGPLLLGLTAVVLWCGSLRRPQFGKAFLLYVLAFLMIVSDRMTIVEVIGPVLGAALAIVVIARSTWRSALLFGLAMGASLRSAWFVLAYIPRAPEPPVPPFSGVPMHIMHSGFWSQTWTYICHFPVAMIVYAGIPLLAFLAYVPLLVVKRKKVEIETLFLWLYGIFALGASILLTALLYEDNGSYRYITPILILPQLFLAALVARWRPRGWVLALSATAFGAWLIAHLAIRGTLFPGSLAWKPPLEVCMEELKSRFSLEGGIADYWLARPLTIVSEETLEVNPVFSDGSPRWFLNDRIWFTHSLADMAKPPRYGFVVMDNLDPGRIALRYGMPNRVVSCEGSQIWMYDDAARFYQSFFR